MPNEHRPPTLTEPDSDDDPLYRAATHIATQAAATAPNRRASRLSRNRQPRTASRAEKNSPMPHRPSRVVA